MNSSTVVENARATEPTANSASEMRKTRLCPYRSPSKPAGSIAAASTRKYPEENHCRSGSDARSDLASLGSATLRTVLSMPTHRTVRNTAPNAHHRRDPRPFDSGAEELMLGGRAQRTRRNR